MFDNGNRKVEGWTQSEGMKPPKEMDMQSFFVTAIVDGDTFDVSPRWQWSAQTGQRVRAAGYDAPELHHPGGQAAKATLERLILGKSVQLGAAYRIDRGRLVADVYLNGRNLTDYFPEYR